MIQEGHNSNDNGRKREEIFMVKRIKVMQYVFRWSPPMFLNNFLERKTEIRQRPCNQSLACLSVVAITVESIPLSVVDGCRLLRMNEKCFDHASHQTDDGNLQRKKNYLFEI
jgi:hypothetical protein